MKSTAGRGMMRRESNGVTRQRLFLVIVSIVVITLTLSLSMVKQKFASPWHLERQQPVELLQRITIVPVHQCSQNANEVSEVNSNCFFTADAGTKHHTYSIRDQVNSNNSCCSIFDACGFGLLELLQCAPFGNGTDKRTFMFHGDDSDTYCNPQCTCTDLINCKIAVVGAFSSNHFNEAQDMIASVQYFYPNIKIIVYDLGLEKGQAENLTASCNVHVEAFPFEKYPEFVKRLGYYSWKPLILGELSQGYEVIVYGDASVRMMKPAIDIMIPLMLRFPLVPGILWSLPIVSLTHDGMLHYLKITLPRKELSKFGHMQAGVWAIWANESAKAKLIGPWTDCAVHKDCIAPNGSSNAPCNMELQKKKGNGIYIGCHRYDQSALSMILIREFGIGVWPRLWYNEMRGVYGIERQVSHHFKVQVCPL